jgi:predicted DNA-binding transcriptional regulator AlpA
MARKTKIKRAEVEVLPQQAFDLHQVLRFRDWIKLAGVSSATGWKLLHSGEGPKWIRIGEKRIGIRVADHIKWIERLSR